MTVFNSNPNRGNLELYPTAVCNLDCSYCQIDKNSALCEIDRLLGESFKDTDYYLNKIQALFPLEGQLKKIELWGGEPLLKIERIFPILRRIVEKYPYFSEVFVSTNFSYPNWKEKIFSLLNVLGEFPERYFKFILQLSCDGPKEMNDLGRGNGTTEKCLKNYQTFIAVLKDNLPKNIFLEIHMKQTLSLENMKWINSKERVIEYYQFFENKFYLPLKNLNLPNTDLIIGTPNFATPAPATKEDGIAFAKICKMCYEVERRAEKYFKVVREITPFASYFMGNCEFYLDKTPSYHGCSTCCGGGYGAVGILPNNLLSICNEGFVQMIEEYKKQYNVAPSQKEASILFNKTYSQNKFHLFCKDEDYNKLEENLQKVRKLDCQPETTIFYSNLASMIVMLALVGQIDEKYKDTKEAAYAAKICGSKNICIKDNYNMTGSITTFQPGELKLFLNGAMEIILDSLRLKAKREKRQ